jgi:hypothetical protein
MKQRISEYDFCYHPIVQTCNYADTDCDGTTCKHPESELKGCSSMECPRIEEILTKEEL